MEEVKPRKRRWIWWLIVPAAVLLLGALTLLFLLGNGGLSARYDDSEAILAAGQGKVRPAVTILPDGSGEMRLGKEDLYWLGRESGISDQIRARLDADSDVTAAGFRISEGRLLVSLGRRVLGRLPLSYQGEMDLRLEDGALVLRTEKVRLGRRLSPGRRFWPGLFREELRIDLTPMGLGEEILGARLEGNALVLDLRGLNAPASGELFPDTELAAVMDYFGDPPGMRPEAAALTAGCGETLSVEELQRFARASGDAPEAMAQALALCRDRSARVLWEDAGTFAREWVWTPLLRRAREIRAEEDAFLAGEQIRYQKLLFAVREMYRSGSLGIGAAGFFNTATSEPVRPDTLSKLSISPTDSRIVFLMSENDSPELSRGDMPPISGVSATSWKSLKELTLFDVVDLGVVLTTEGDIPVLLHRRADGTMVIRQLTQEQFVAVLVAQGIPRVDMDHLPGTGQELELPPGEGQVRTVLLPLRAE